MCFHHRYSNIVAHMHFAYKFEVQKERRSWAPEVHATTKSQTWGGWQGREARAPLHEAEQGLVPDDGQRAFFLAEAQEVVHQRVDHPVGQRVLLVQQHLQGEAAEQNPQAGIQLMDPGTLTTVQSSACSLTAACSKEGRMRSCTHARCAL